MSDYDPMDYIVCQAPVHGILQARITGEGCHFLLQGIFPTQGSPALQTDSLPSEPPRKQTQNVRHFLNKIFRFTEKGQCEDLICSRFKKTKRQDN